MYLTCRSNAYSFSVMGYPLSNRGTVITYHTIGPHIYHCGTHARLAVSMMRHRRPDVTLTGVGVEKAGLEPATICLQSSRSTNWSYIPKDLLRLFLHSPSPERQECLSVAAAGASQWVSHNPRW